MGDLHLLRRELDSATLAAPYDLIASENTGSFLFFRRGQLEAPGVAAVRNWLLAEAPADELGIAARRQARS